MTNTPNILLIVIDQFRGDLLTDSPLGRVAQLPHLRALMDEAVTFPRHYTVVAPCGPSRASLLTGQYATNHGVVRNGTPLRHDTPNLATEIRKAGYVPKLFGYTDSANDPRVMAADDPRLQTYEDLMPGFDEALRMRMESDDQPWRDHMAAKGAPLPDYPETYRPNGPKVTDPAVYSAEDSDTAFLTDGFLDFAATADSGWCATLTYVRPHPPFVAPAPYNTMYDPADMPPCETTGSDRAWHDFMAPAQDKALPASTVEGFPDLQASDQTTADLRAIYLGLASEVDHHIGRVIAALKASAQWDDTVLVVTSDHGEMLGDFGLWGKGSFHDAAFHVPLIIRDPNQPAMHGQSVGCMTQSIDVTPSILERVGASVPHAMNGDSLLPFLADVGAEHRTVSTSTYDFGHPIQPTTWQNQLGIETDAANLAVLRTDRHRLVHFACDLPPVVFDMERDGEHVNIADDTGLCLDLTQQLLSHRMANTDGTFSRTIVDGGLHVAD